MSLRLIPSIHRAAHRIGLYIADRCGDGLTQGEAHILAHLADGPMTVGDLHRALAHNRSTLTSILDRLSRRGLVTREAGAADRRTFVVRPTPRGRLVARRVLKDLTQLEGTALADLPAGDVRALERVLAAIERTAHRDARRVARSATKPESTTKPRDSNAKPRRPRRHAETDPL